MNINYKEMRIENGSKVLVHFCCMSSCKEENQVLIDICKEKGITFIGVELPGQGEAEIIATIDKPEILYLARLATIHFNQINCDEIIISGHGMGAAIALIVAATSYDKVSRIILESPVNPSILSTVGARENLETIVSNITKQTKFIDGQFKIVEMNDDTKKFFYEIGRDLASEKIIKELKKDLSKVSDKRIDALFGEEDPIIPCVESTRLIKRIGKPNIVSHVIPNAKHSIHNDNKEAYRQIITQLL